MQAPTLKAKLDQSLKEAMLSKQAETVSVIRGVKSAILYEEVAQKKRDVGLTDAEIEQVLAKQAKQRQESADLFRQGGNEAKAAQELSEKAIIEGFLPAQLSDAELAALVEKIATENADQPMGKLIGLVKQQAGPAANGSQIAQLVKARLSQ